MAKPDESINPRLIACAKEIFLTLGFEKASTNAICKEAKVTTGALFKRYATKEDLFGAIVEPVAGEFKQLLRDEKQGFEGMSVEQQEEQVLSYETFDFIEYVYLHFDEFKLLLECAQGTKYENYVEELVDVFAQSLAEFMKSSGKKAMIAGKPASPDLIHILTRSYLTGVFEPVLHNMPKNKAKVYAEQIGYFFGIGWADILGLER